MRSSYFPHPPLLIGKLCDIILYLFTVYLITGGNQRFQAAAAVNLSCGDRFL